MNDKHAYIDSNESLLWKGISLTDALFSEHVSSFENEMTTWYRVFDCTRKMVFISLQDQNFLPLGFLLRLLENQFS
jgi:hypothetical protein